MIYHSGSQPGHHFDRRSVAQHSTHQFSGKIFSVSYQFLRNTIVMSIAMTFLLLHNFAAAQNTRSEATILADAKSFMASYAEDLLAGKKEAIIGRYDARGYYRVGEGRKTFVSADDTRKQYLERWRAPVAMEWRDLSYEVVGKEGVMVIGLLDWAISAENKVTFSYTGLLTYQEGGLKLRLEDESRRVPPPAPVKADAGVAK